MFCATQAMLSIPRDMGTPKRNSKVINLGYVTSKRAGLGLPFFNFTRLTIFRHPSERLPPTPLQAGIVLSTGTTFPGKQQTAILDPLTRGTTNKASP